MKKLNKIIKITLLLFITIVSNQVYSSTMQSQTIRGQIIDQDSKTSLIGANIIIIESNPIRGTSSDFDGYFRLEDVHVGRINLKISCLGYEDKIIPNILVGAGKEIVFDWISVQD